MNDSDRRYLAAFRNEDVFMADNAADFPPGSAGAQTSAQAAALTAEIERRDAAPKAQETQGWRER